MRDESAASLDADIPDFTYIVQYGIASYTLRLRRSTRPVLSVCTVPTQLTTQICMLEAGRAFYRHRISRNHSVFESLHATDATDGLLRGSVLQKCFRARDCLEEGTSC
jgi:hypothetical protein